MTEQRTKYAIRSDRRPHSAVRPRLERPQVISGGTLRKAVHPLDDCLHLPQVDGTLGSSYGFEEVSSGLTKPSQSFVGCNRS